MNAVNLGLCGKSDTKCSRPIDLAVRVGRAVRIQMKITMHQKNRQSIATMILWFFGGGVLLYFMAVTENPVFFVPLFAYCGFIVWLNAILGRCPKCGKNVFYYPMRWLGLDSLKQDTYHMFAPEDCPHCAYSLKSDTHPGKDNGS